MPIMICHLLDGVDSAGRLLGPPCFGFLQVGLDGVSSALEED